MCWNCCGVAKIAIFLSYKKEQKSHTDIALVYVMSQLVARFIWQSG
jgi:hypothetical protein